MRIVLAFSNKEGLLQEYRRKIRGKAREETIPPDFFAEGDSPETIQAIVEALAQEGHHVTALNADEKFGFQLEKIRPDMVFNIAEGLWGDFRESYVPMLCEQLGIPYTGSDPLTLAICLNKARAKEILGYYLIPTAPFRVFYPLQEIEVDDFEFPAIVKPVSEGSSKGIFNDSVVHDPREARARIREKMALYNQPILIEKFLSGQEFTVAIWGNGTDTEILPIVGINYSQLPSDANPIYSYEAKWLWDTPDKPLEIFECPARIASALQESIENVVLDSYRVLNIRDWCRVDVRVNEEGLPYILELNPLPGILPDPKENSCFPKAARTAGYTYPQIINRVLKIAAKRYRIAL